MRITKQFVGGCICAFGVGIVITTFLPLGVMLIVAGSLAACAGALAFCR